MRETGCSHLPTGAHLLFYSPLHLQRHSVKQIYQGIIFTCWRYECTAPPSGHTQPNMEAIHGEMWDFLAVHLKVCLHSTEQPTAIINKWRLLILCSCVSVLKTYYLLVISVCIYVCVVYLKGDTANRQVLVILQHAEVLSHQGGSVHQTHCRLRVTLPVVVLLCHVLQPGQAEVRRRLVAFRYPGEIWEWEKGSFSPLIHLVKAYLRSKSPYQKTVTCWTNKCKSGS